MKRTLLATVLALPILACLVVAAVPSLFGLEQAPIVAQVVAVRIGVVGIAVVLALLFCLLLAPKASRRFAGVVITMLVVFSLVSSGIHFSRGTGSGEAVQDGDVTVLSWNTLGDEPSVDQLVALILETEADIVALPETTGEYATEAAVVLRDAGHPFWVHTTHFSLDYGALSTSLMISADLGEYTTDLEIGQTRTLPTIVATPDDDNGPTIVATHPVAPIPQQMRNWRSDLDFIASLCGQSDSVIMAGDFNSTVDHWSSLGSDGGDIGTCRDAAASVGAGTSGTWPSSLPAWLGAQIDHVVATPDWKPIDARVITSTGDSGSDHRPIVAVLREQQSQ
ncbi:endonuclease/exonuclease/phosphatase family protein [Agrococcus casei]|uniref:Xaa-Pro aminopeptidase n=1 Tax=Agrococcus casei LMG 22410 TaxID=1255656 RepID=A0A1R4FX31_9MICO|nr:endonuclease/exonuclease/phosphatase family protein [Agrococcus casei]SJM60494.1 Xaa-Pro aminopeptidase [Agrococcus casei LMG 22410]